jgi:uncharacterized protein (TIGR02453 family)
MSKSRSVFTQDSFDWLTQITLNNSREQFQASKAQYEQSLKSPLLDLLLVLAESIGGVPKIFRPNRDVRFSANKSPYKTSISGYLHDAKEMLYIELSLEGFMVGTGYHQMAKDQIQRYREVLTGPNGSATGESLRSLMSLVEAQGEGLKGVPRGMSRDHENADLLGFTSITCFEKLSPDEAITTDLLGLCTQFHLRTKPLNDWLVTNVGKSTLEW